MAKLTKAEFDHLVKKHIRAEKHSGKICVTVTMECGKNCQGTVSIVHICRYPPCPC